MPLSEPDESQDPPYIPANARWFVAEIVLETKIEGESTTVIDINVQLVEAHTAEESYSRAMGLGKSQEITYQNTDGKTVTVFFRGLQDLNVIHDKLGHGCELFYSRLEANSGEEVQELLTPKGELSVFKRRVR